MCPAFLPKHSRAEGKILNRGTVKETKAEERDVEGWQGKVCPCACPSVQLSVCFYLSMQLSVCQSLRFHVFVELCSPVGLFLSPPL